MKIAIVGYGKMGKMMESLAPEFHMTIAERYDSQNPLTDESPLNVDVAIDFTEPKLAATHVQICLQKGVAIVVGTTGWYDQFDAICRQVDRHQGALFYATNFSIGVNLFFKMNEIMARLMKGNGYRATLTEIHHTAKKDAPSGTAISLAEGILKAGEYEQWKLVDDPNQASANELPVLAHRQDPVPGTHSIVWSSSIDTLHMEHIAHSREGFARGALQAAQWIFGKTGVFNMQDMLNFTDSQHS
ncbi:MAG: 4-hydroxy-tetrahydrodipicolinate reductase [Bacteroidia bacterium]